MNEDRRDVLPAALVREHARATSTLAESEPKLRSVFLQLYESAPTSTAAELDVHTKYDEAKVELAALASNTGDLPNELTPRDLDCARAFTRYLEKLAEVRRAIDKSA
jgi:hypothetical protein